MLRRMFTFAFLLAAGCANRHPSIYQLPSGYRGWVRIDYERHECPSVLRGNRNVFLVSNEGVACTRDRFEEGEAADEFYYRERGALVPLRARGASIRLKGYARIVDANGITTHQFESFFVGSDEELQKTPQPKWF